MKKMFFSLLALIVTGIINTYGQNTGNYEVSTEVLNVVTEPDSNGKVAGKLKAKQVVQVVEFKNGWASIVFVNNSGKKISGYVKSEFITPATENVNNVTEQSPQDKTLQKVFGGTLVFCLICYIIAMVRTRKGKMITIVNWYDFTLLFSPFILWLIAIGWYSNKNADSGVLPIVLFIVGGLCFTGSMVWSIIANKGSVFNMIVSIFAKLFVVMIIWVIILYFFRGKKTKKTVQYNGHSYTRDLTAYEQEIEDAKYKKNNVAAIGIAGFLIFSLIQSVNHKELTEKLKYRVQ
jgi:hypothetical protein